MLSKFKGLNFRLTPQILAILGILAESAERPAFDEIYQKVKIQFPTTSNAFHKELIDRKTHTVVLISIFISIEGPFMIPAMEDVWQSHGKHLPWRAFAMESISASAESEWQTVCSRRDVPVYAPLLLAETLLTKGYFRHFIEKDYQFHQGAVQCALH